MLSLLFRLTVINDWHGLLVSSNDCFTEGREFDSRIKGFSSCVAGVSQTFNSLPKDIHLVRDSTKKLMKSYQVQVCNMFKQIQISLCQRRV